VPWYGDMETYDYDMLTRLVVMSHDRLLRAEVKPRHHWYLTLRFHRRKSRDGEFHERMPTLEDHVSAIRKTLPEATLEQD